MTQRMVVKALWVVVVPFVLVHIGAAPCHAQASSPPGEEKVGDGVISALEADGETNVIIALKEPPSRRARHIDLPTLRNEITSLQDHVLSALEPSHFKLKHRYRTVAGLAGRVTKAGLEQLLENPNVVRIDSDVGGSGGLADSVPLIHADLWHQNGTTGDGVVVAVIDSGIDTDHSDLADDLVDQACFGDDDGTIDGTGFCPDGSDRQSGPGAAEDDHGHGTHVTGIITSNGTVSSVGVAPGAHIVSIKVLDQFNRFYFFSEIVAAFDFIINGSQNIRIINLSLSTDHLFAGDCDNSTSYNMLGAAAVDTLRTMGIITIAISGNDGSGTNMGSPGCLSRVVSVGATDKTDAVAPFSNSNASLDVMAPGVGITSTYLSNGTTVMSGTSMASPHAAGCAALFIDAGVAASPDEIEARLKYSPVQVTDPKNNLTFPRIDCTPIVVADFVTVPAALGGGNVTITTSAGSFSSASGEDPATMIDTPSGFDFPHGMFSFMIAGLTPGETATVTLTFPAPLPDDAVWYWYNPTVPAWMDITGSVAWSGTAASLSMTDGGIGDRDGVQNGVIDDPLGPAVAAPPPPPPPGGGGGGGGGGGCNLATAKTATAGSNLASLLVLLALAAWGIVQLTTRKSTQN